jgi:hypothetical protein
MMAFLRSSRGRWYLLALFWVVVITLGIGGFVQQGHESGQPRPFTDVLYLTLQLATLDYDGSNGPMNWRLQIGRFVVPVMAASTVLQTASVVFTAEFNRLRISRSNRHTVVAGLGDVGQRLATALAASGERVVAVDPEPARVAAARDAHEGIAAIVGDPADPAMLSRVRIDRARRLVVAAGDDALNVAVASAAAAAVGQRRQALRCAVQLSDVELASLLRAADLDAAGGVRLSYFSLHERAARALLSENPPFESPAGHPLVIGLGQFGRSLVVALGQQWAHLHPGEPMRATLIDANASGRWAELSLRHPALVDVCRPQLVDLDLEQPSAAGLAEFARLLEEDPPSWVAVVVDDERLALANAVFLHQRFDRESVPVVVRMGSASGLGALLDPVSGSEQAVPGVRVFPFLDRTCTLESVDGGIREQLAEAVHQDYLAAQPADAPAGGLRRPWGELDDDERDLSRRRVDGIVGDLAAIGCELQPLRRWGDPAVHLTEEEIELLAEREHRRWYDDRVAAGWTHGEVRDDGAKRNPLLVDWADLPPDARQYNLDAVRALQPMLARAGFEAVRR